MSKRKQIDGLNFLWNKPVYAITAALVLIFIYPWADWAQAKSQSLEPVTIQLRWSHQFQFAGYYAALEKGFYAQEGLRVTLRPYEPGHDPVNRVLGGHAQYGVGDSSLLKLRSGGKPVVVLAQIFQHSPEVLITLQSSAILSPEDLAGRRLMMPERDHGGAAVQAMILDSLHSMDRIKIIPHAFTPEPMLTGKVDAMTAYLSNEPFRLKRMGHPVTILDPRSFGIDFYGDNFFTTESEVQTRPERMKKMIRATLKGWTYALENKEEIIDLIHNRYNSALEKEQLSYEAKVIDQMMVPDLIPVGQISPMRYQRMAGIYHRLGMIPAAQVPKGFLYQEVMAGNQAAVAKDLTPEERAWLGAHPDIHLGYTDAFEPEIIKNQDGSYSGMLVDFMALLNKKLGTRISLKIDGIAEILEKAQTKKVDGLLNIYPSYSDQLGLLKTRSYWPNYPGVFARKGTLFYLSNGFDNKRVAILDKVFYIQELMKVHGQNATLVKVATPLEGLQALERGEVDFMVGASLNSYTIIKYQLMNLALIHVFSDSPTLFGIGVRPDWPILVSILNKGLDRISRDEILSISRKWSALPIPSQQVKLTLKERVWLNDHPGIRLGFTDALPPSVIANDDGSFSGIYIDFFSDLSKRLGTDIKIEIDTIPNILTKAKTRQVDGLMALHPAKAEKLGLLSTKGYNTVYPTVFARNETRFTDPGDFKGKRVALVDKVYYVKTVIETHGQGAQVIMAKNVLDGFQKLQNGEADYFISTSRHRYLIDKYRLTQIVPKYTFFEYSQKFSAAIRPDWPMLVSILNKGIDSFSAREMDKFVSKWTSMPEEKKPFVQLTLSEKEWVGAHPSFKVGVFPVGPYQYMAEEQFKGYGVDLIKAIAEKTGLVPEFSYQPLAAMLSQMEKGKIDVGLTLAFSKERSEFLDFSEKKFEFKMGIFGHSQNGTIRDLMSMRGKTISSYKGYALVGLLRDLVPDMKIIFADDAVGMLRLVAEGKADAAVQELHSGEFLLRQHFINNIERKGIVETPDKMAWFAHDYAVCKKFPLLKSILDKSYAAMEESDKQRIWQKWFSQVIEKKLASELILTPDETDWILKGHRVRVRVGQFPPTCFIRDRQPVGLAIDLLNRVAQRTGIKFDYILDPPSFPQDVKGIIARTGPDLLPVLQRTPDREKHLLFTQSYQSSPMFIFTRDDAPFVSSLEDLADKQVVVEKGYVIHDRLKAAYPKIILKVCENSREALETLASRQAFAYIGSLQNTGAMINQWGLVNLRAVAKTALPDGMAAMGVRNDWPQLKQIIDKVMQAIPADEKAVMAGKWSSIHFESGIHASTAVKWVLLASGIGGSVLTVFLFWNRRLTREIRQRKGAEFKAKQASQAKSRFLANMSHELRTPMNAILGFSRLLAKDDTLAPDHREQVKIIDKSGEHLIGMVNEILDMARIEAGETELKPEAFIPAQMVTDIGQMIAPKVESKGLVLSLDIDPEICPSLEGDVGKIRQVLINLLGNAVKFTEKGGIAIRAGTHSLGNARCLFWMEIQDTGPGIAKADQDNIFDSFDQGQRNATQGTGLGLTISRALIQHMDGKINVDSQLGKGSLFQVEIPAKVLDPSLAVEQTRRKGKITGRLPGQPPLKILVAEDNADSRMLLCQELKPLGFDVQEAHDGQAAVQIFKNWHPHLIWMDIRMPMMDGLAATRKIRTLPGGDTVKIVAITASAFKGEQSQILAAGCDGLVLKPYKDHEIYEAMARYLGLAYEFETEPSGISGCKPGMLSADMLGRLPDNVLKDFEHAIIRLDREASFEVIQTIESISPEIAAGLKKLMENFQMGRIQDLIKESRGEK